jgi:hypothetical protein
VCEAAAEVGVQPVGDEDADLGCRGPTSVCSVFGLGPADRLDGLDDDLRRSLDV